jgi:hypothetical protein
MPIWGRNRKEEDVKLGDKRDTVGLSDSIKGPESSRAGRRISG